MAFEASQEMSRFQIRQKIKNLIEKWNGIPTAKETGRNQEETLETVLSAYEKLANWCREQGPYIGEDEDISTLFVKITIENTKKEMLADGWPKK